MSTPDPKPAAKPSPKGVLYSYVVLRETIRSPKTSQSETVFSSEKGHPRGGFVLSRDGEALVIAFGDEVTEVPFSGVKEARRS